MGKKAKPKSKKPNSRSKGKPRRLRRGLLIALVLLLVGGGLLTYKRRDAWFSNSPEASYYTLDSIDRITLVPGVRFDSERSITWRCGEAPRTSWLEYGLAGADTIIEERRWLPARAEVVETRSGRGCYYQAKLYGLEPGRTYRYRLHTGAEHSPRYDFTIPADSLRSEFVYIGDVQDPSGAMSDSLLPRLRTLLPRIDFLAAGGDQIEGPTSQYWDIWYKALGDWSPQLTILAATGNHEYLKRGFLRELDPRWTASYAYPKNGPEGFEGRSYYVDFPLLRYIVMDSNGIRSPLDVTRHRAWLSEVLRSSQQAWQIVMFHHAIYNVREGRMHPVMRYAFRGILEEDGADLVLQGHDHAYSRISSRNDEGVPTTPMYIVSSSSPKLYRNGFDEIHDRLGSGLQLYQHIVVTSDSLHYRSHQYDGQLYDDVILHRPSSSGAIRIEDRAGAIPEEFRFSSFASDEKGQQKAAKYRQAVADYLASKKQSKQ